MKEYFSHDYHARGDEKVKKLIRETGYEGYGLYWAIIETLYEAGGYIERNYEGIAFDMRTQSERIANVVDNFGLFSFSEENMIFSESVLKRLKTRNDKSKSAKKSAQHRWRKEKQGDANALRDECERNAIKGKESKVKEIVSSITVSNESQKNENEEFFKKLETDSESIMVDMNIPENQKEVARRELFKFWNYWTEKDVRGREKWKSQKTFEVKRRLTSWLMNTKQFNSNQSHEKPGRIVG